MNQQFLTGKRLIMRSGWRGLLLMGVLLSLTACSLLSNNPALGDTAELQGQATVVCSASCAERGQCGSAPDGSQAVLGGQAGPVVENHDLRFMVDTAVPIIQSRVEKAETLIGGEQFDLRFYHIQRSDGITGWVAGWCLAAAQ